MVSWLVMVGVCGLLVGACAGIALDRRLRASRAGPVLQYVIAQVALTAGGNTQAAFEAGAQELAAALSEALGVPIDPPTWKEIIP